MRIHCAFRVLTQAKPFAIAEEGGNSIWVHKGFNDNFNLKYIKHPYGIIFEPYTLLNVIEFDNFSYF